ncbi:deoxyribodipyrimidine photolyase [Nonlabens dokdonensis]|uniref:Cryptochrome DASH n=1 Tax=Nonlabens dokdonensis TaxID=328515 RepID=A0A1Z8AM22_9FLAO|nr:DASH family cryptochrome [Nonlabens dokdonensis]OUS11395.1 deoxyribodipyrimidine photolyase [Nonlabens dokdonensis]
MSNLVWFRNDLRVTDNHSLKAACDREGDVIGVYCFDPAFYQESDFGFDLDFELPFTKTGKYRAQFIIEALEDLKKQLQNHGIPLLVFHKSPAQEFPELIKELGVQHIFLQKEWTRDEVQQEEKLGEALEEAGLKDQVKGHRVYDQFLFHPDDVPFENFNQIPKVFTEFRKKCEKQSEVRDLVNIDDYKQELPEVEQTELPTLNDLGLERFEKDHRSAFPWKGGATAAWERLDHYFWETKKLQYYKKTRNGLVGTDYSSKFSAWLAIGAISAREIYWEVKHFEKEIKKNQDTYWLIFELIWRDFFKYVSLKHESNIFQLGGILKKDYEWKSSERELSKWIQGETHERFVNANMKELAATGFMSNRGRQNVASYWSMHKEQDWRIGAAYFEHILIDYDVHSNYGNWMYNSGVGNDPRNRTFNIKSQANRYDGDGKFQNLWLQENLF